MSSKVTTNADPIAVEGTSLDELVDRISELVEAGKTGDVQTLIGEHPQHADRLRTLLPAIEAMATVEGLSVDGLSVDDVTGDREATRQLGDFQLIREIGRGGMGVVYEAEQISLGRRVALKVLPLAATLTPQQLERFKNEARAVATLKHPHIVGVYSVGVERGVHYYAMELIEGETLAQTIAELSKQATTAVQEASPDAETVTAAALSTVRTKSPQKYYRQMARLMADAAEAIDYAHNRGVLHRDIKPANLMLDRESHVWVTDFGLARLESDVGVTLTGDILGTLRYMSPEQAAGKTALVDYRTDIHALGATLYELVALQPAFAGSERADVLRKIIESPPAPLRQVAASLPADLETIVSKAMEKDPADRYQTASELAADLRAFADERSITARPPSMATKINRWVRRHAALTAAALAVLLLATGGLGAALAAINGERVEKAVALDDAQRSLQFARQAVDDMYTGVATDWLASDLELTPTKREFLEKALRIYQRLADDAPDDLASQWEAGTAYARVAQIQHKLAQYRQAESAYELSIDVHEEQLDALADDPDRRAQLAGTYRDLGRLHLDQEQLTEAAAAWDASRALLIELNDTYPTEPDYHAALAISDLDQAGLLVRRGKLAEAERLATAADRTFTSLRGGNADSLAYKLGQHQSRVLLARLLRFDGKLDEAREIARRVERESSYLMDEAHDSLPLGRVRTAASIELADALMAADDYTEALEVLDRARGRLLESFGRNVSPNRLMTDTIAGQAEWTRYAEPEAFRQFIEIDMRRGYVLGKLGQAYAAQQTLADTVRAAYVLKHGERPMRFAITAANARVQSARLLQHASHPEAQAVATSAARTWQHVLRDSANAATYTSGLFTSADLAGFLELFPEQQSAVDATTYTPDPPTFNEGLVVMRVANGVSWYRGGSPADALMFLKDFTGTDSGADSYAWYYLAMAYHRLGKADEARRMFQQADDWMDSHQPGNAELSQLRTEAAQVLASEAPASVQPVSRSVTLTGGEEALPDSTQAEAR